MEYMIPVCIAFFKSKILKLAIIIYNDGMQKIIRANPAIREALHKCYRRIDDPAFIESEARLDELLEDNVIYAEVDHQRVYGYIGVSRFLTKYLFEDDADPLGALDRLLLRLGLGEEDVACIIAVGIDPSIDFDTHFKLLMDFAKSKCPKGSLILSSREPFNEGLFRSLKKNGFHFMQQGNHYAYYRYVAEGLARGLAW